MLRLRTSGYIVAEAGLPLDLDRVSSTDLFSKSIFAISDAFLVSVLKNNDPMHWDHSSELGQVCWLPRLSLRNNPRYPCTRDLL